MKTLLSILLFIAAATQSLLAQTTTITIPYVGSGPYRQQDIPVQAGEVFELLTWGLTFGGPTSLNVDGVPVNVVASNPSANTALSPSFVIAGPRTISLIVPNSQSLVCTYKLSIVATVATQNVASQAVVIPENGSANADIILESSTDLTNWTAAVAGSYAPSTSKRFFRVRLVAH